MSCIVYVTYFLVFFKIIILKVLLTNDPPLRECSGVPTFWEVEIPVSLAVVESLKVNAYIDYIHMFMTYG